MEIVLVRHAQPEWIRDGLNVVDPPLTELGRQQAELLAAHLLEEDFDEILVSPLRRARETAAPLLELLGRDEHVATWLREIGDPDWHGQPAELAERAYEELRTRPSHERWEGLEGGETVREFSERIQRGVDEFLAERGVTHGGHQLPLWHVADPGARVALIAHAGTNSMTIGRLLGYPATPWEWERIVLMHASVTRVEAVPSGDHHLFSLTRLSDVEHLDRDLRTR